MSYSTPFVFPNGVRVANRLAVAPMTTAQSEPDGRLSAAEAAWLGQLGEDGYGLLLTCAAAISRDSIAFPNQLSFGDDRVIADLAPLTARMRAAGTLPLAQLCHGGSRALPALTGRPARSASAYPLPVPGWVEPIPFTADELAQLVDAHVAAARRAAAAGFGGVELHGAHGYLFTQFLSRQSNLRTDDWGGPLENRARLLRSVVRAVRREVPRDFVLGVRLSMEGAGLETGLDLDENIQVLRWLAEDGIDYGHVSLMDAAAPSTKYPSDATLLRVRAGVGPALPLMVAGGLWSPTDVERALALGADLVALGRAALGNPDVPGRFARGEALVRPPYTRAHLEARGISPAFLAYLTAPGPLSALHIVA